MVAIPVEFLADIAASYIETRDPKGGGGGGHGGGGGGHGGSSGGGKSGGSKGGSYGAGGGGTGEPLSTGAIIAIVVVTVWTLFFICCWAYFYHKAKTNNETLHLMGKSCGRALLFALLITPVIWLFKKIIGFFKNKVGKLGKGRYAQVDEDKRQLVNASADTGYYGRGGEQGNSKYEPMGYHNAARPSPAPFAPSPMTSRAPSPTPPTTLPPPAHPPPYSGPAAGYYAPPSGSPHPPTP